MTLSRKIVASRGRGLELVLTGRRVDAPRRLPVQPLDAARLVDGGALSGPMFEQRPGLLRRLIRRVLRWMNR